MMNTRWLLLLCLLLGLFLGPRDSFAWEVQTGFLIGQQEVHFIEIPVEALTISKNCRRELQSHQSWNCDAHRALRKATMRGVRIPTGLGTNPGIPICRRVGGTVVIGTTAQGDQNAFCRFGDGSLVDTGSLHAFARKNDGTDKP